MIFILSQNYVILLYVPTFFFKVVFQLFIFEVQEKKNVFHK